MRYQRIKFCDVYYLADSIWKAIVTATDEILLEALLNPIGDGLASYVTTPSRYTTLHYFIHSYYTYLLDEFQHQGEINTVIDEYEFILKSYGIEIMEEPGGEIVLDRWGWCEKDECYYHVHNERYYPYWDNYNDIYDVLRSAMPIDAIVNTTFQVLFNDREFLYCFNKKLAETIRSLKKADHPDILEKDGVLKRSSLPTWAKRGVFFRDRGRCIKCGKDLTGTVVTGEVVHYDHIVPLAEGGTNDPTNFQTLCETCNLKKGKLQTGTSDLYPIYWEMG